MYIFKVETYNKNRICLVGNFVRFKLSSYIIFYTTRISRYINKNPCKVVFQDLPLLELTPYPTERLLPVLKNKRTNFQLSGVFHPNDKILFNLTGLKCLTTIDRVLLICLLYVNPVVLHSFRSCFIFFFRNHPFQSLLVKLYFFKWCVYHGEF